MGRHGKGGPERLATDGNSAPPTADVGYCDPTKGVAIRIVCAAVRVPPWWVICVKEAWVAEEYFLEYLWRERGDTCSSVGIVKLRGGGLHGRGIHAARGHTNKVVVV